MTTKIDGKFAIRERARLLGVIAQTREFGPNEIRQTADDLVELLKLWDTRDAALRALLERFNAKRDEAAERATALTATNPAVAASLVPVVATYRECAAALETVLED